MHHLLPFLLVLVDDVPEPEEVKAGWTAFAVFLLLCVAVALLGWSLTRQLRKAERAKESGVLPSTKEEQAAREQAAREAAARENHQDGPAAG